MLSAVVTNNLFLFFREYEVYLRNCSKRAKFCFGEGGINSTQKN